MEKKEDDLRACGAVDDTDLGILGANWLFSGSHILNPNADINGDGTVDVSDLAIMGRTGCRRFHSPPKS